MLLLLTKRLQHNHNIFIRQEIYRKIIKMYALYSILIKSEKEAINKGKRKYWVSPIFTVERRLAQGASNNLVNELEQQDREIIVIIVIINIVCWNIYRLIFFNCKYEICMNIYT